ncbi:hypothetical protein [Streptomyces sp. NBC_01500]|uniref:hypothetical protein n=1 Tax=Streptomyces sp. NBC_01500 TaxID=2903886 RepID=UPI00225439B9|nr:hypothetical protein [Streptomyces sp. NBC_01500]MCX4549261.1 hypothetical protein [Streptomyces sp. NBC_01500]
MPLEITPGEQRAIDAAHREALQRKAAEAAAGPRHKLESITHGTDGSVNFRFS